MNINISREKIAFEINILLTTWNHNPKFPQ